MNAPKNQFNKKMNYTFLAIAALIPLIIYWLTAYRTITWWVGTSYTMTAITFGINFPPGSLILTILGWLAAQLPLGISKAFTLNLFAGIMSSFTFFMILILSLKIFNQTQNLVSFQRNNKSRILVISGLTAGCLIFSFSSTVWLYSIQFTPYILTAVFTTIILWAMLQWWKLAGNEENLRWLFIILLLFGLDFSVHRTNLLLLPGLLFWILLRYPRTLLQVKAWFAGGVGFILGLAFHLLTMPIAAANPLVNANNPSNWSRFYDYISLKQYGGGWLVNLFPRKASVFNVQLADYIDYLKSNFINTDGSLGIFGILLPLLALAGVIILWRKNWRLCLGLLILYICLSFGAVFYFNMPENFYWPMDRHYIPSCIIFVIFAAYGCGWILLYLQNNTGKYRMIISALVLLLMVLIPVKQIAHNYDRVNGSNKYFAYDYAHNILNTLPENSILFINGDNYWPLLYFNKIENVRPDITILSQNLINTKWYFKQALSRNPDLPVRFSEEDIMNYGPRHWRDTTITTKIRSDAAFFNLPSETKMPDTFSLQVKPTVSGKIIMGHDWFTIKLLTENEWQHPVYFNDPLSWLKGHSRPEGLVWRLIPQETVELNVEILQDNLFNKYSYRGYADPNIFIDRFSKSVGSKYYQAFLALAQYEFIHEDTAAFIDTFNKMTELLPIERLEPPPRIIKTIEMLETLRQNP